MGVSTENEKKSKVFSPSAWGLPSAEIKTLGQRLYQFWERYAECFETTTRDVSHYALGFLSGLLRMTTERNFSNIARTTGESPQNVQHFMTNSPWSAQEVLQQIREEVAQEPSFAEGSALILDESAAFGKGRFLRDFFADLLQDLLCRPRRIGHKMLHILRRLSGCPRDVAEIAFCGHSQQPAEKAQGVMTHITRRSFKTFGIAFQELIQTLAEGLDLGARQSPSAGTKNFAFFLILGADTHLFGVPAIQLFLNCLALFFRSEQM